MRWKTTLSGKLKKALLTAMTFTAITLMCVKSYAQTRIYASEVTYTSPNGMSSLLGCGTLALSPCYNTVSVVDASNALAADNTFSRVKSGSGLALGIGAYQGELELKFPTALAAGTTSYIRINNANPDLLNSLLGGNLGNLLADVVGTVVLGNRYFEAGARMGTGSVNTVLAGNSASSFSNDNLKLIKDANGYFYIAITPNAAYDRVYIKDFTNAVLGLGASSYTDVYYAFYGSGTDPCAQSFATSFDGNGLSLDLLGLGKAGVTRPERLIDADPNSFSELSLGVLGVAGSISQDIYFETLSNPGDELNLKIQAAPALLNVGLLNNLRVTAYNGTVPVSTQRFSDFISLDLLGLLNSGQTATIPFSSALPFNRIRITLSSLLSASLTQTVNLYSAIRSAGRPTFTAPASNAVSVCSSTVASLTATTTSNNELLWYESSTGGTAVATVAYNAAYVTPALTANKTYYVAARRIGCTAESLRVPVVVTVNPAIVFPTLALSNATVASAYLKQITVATGGTPAFSYILTPGSALPVGLTLSPAGEIGGTPTVSGDFTFSITATDSKGCTAIANYTLKVTAALALPAAILPNGIVGTVYPVQTLPAATGGTTPYTYTATNLPPGLTFDPVTRQITGTPTLSGTFVIPVTASDANGNSVSINYTIVVKDPLVLAVVPLADGTVGTVYTIQTIPQATGGTAPYTYAATNLPPGLIFDPLTREITGTPTLSGTFSIPVTVTDTDGKTTTSNFSIEVKNPLSLASGNLPDGTVAVVYTPQTIPSATGGTGPYTYTATNLPPGLVFNPTTRVVSGTPTQSGTYTIPVTAKDADGNTVTAQYTVKVTGQLNLPAAILPNGTVDVLYATQTLPAASGGTLPYTYTATNVPAGLTFNPATRQLSGTPTLGGTFIISIKAVDNGGNQTNTDYSLAVNVTNPVVANATICSGKTATLTVSNNQPHVTYRWYAATGNTVVFTGVNYTTPILNSNTTFYAEAISGTAVSSRIAVTVTVSPAPALPVVTVNNVISPGQSTVLSASTTAGNTISWYQNATGGTALANGANFTTPVLNVTTTYYVESVSATGCSSLSRLPVTVTVTTGTTNPNCNAANGQQTGVDGLCLLCSINGAENSTDNNPNNFTRINLVVGVGATGYQRLIFQGAGAATDSIRLDLETPTGLLDLSVLGGITVNVMSGNTIVKTYVLNSSLLDLKLLSSNRFLATLVAGAAFDRVEVRFGAVVSALSNLNIYGAKIVYPNPTATAGNQTICSNTTAVLTATPNGGTTLSWYNAPTGGTLLASGNTYTTVALTATTTYYIQVSKAGCANDERVPVVVTVTPVQTVPVLATIAPICAGSSTILSVNAPVTGTTYTWYATAVSTVPLFTGPDFTTPVLNANTNYFVEASNGTCKSASRAQASVTVNPRPVLPQVQASATTVNPGQTAILTASSASANVNFNWYTTATSINPVFTGAVYVTPPLFTNTTYYVETVSTVTGCTSTGRVQITVNVNSGGSPDPVACESPVTESHGVNGVLAVLAGINNPGLAIDNDKSTASTLLMPVGLLASVWQKVGFTGLSNVGDTVRIRLTSGGQLLSASVLGGISLTSFSGTTSNNDAINLNNALIRITLLSGGTDAIIEFVPAVPFDGIELRLNSGVLGALTAVNFNYAQRIIKTPIVSAPNVTACANTKPVLTVNNPQTGIVYKWYDAVGTYQADGISFTTPAITADTKFYVEATRNGCTSARTTVNVTVIPAPQTPVLLSATVQTCSGSNLSFQVQNPVVGQTYQWFKNGVIIPLETTATLNVTGITANATYTVKAINSCGTASAGQATVVVTVGVLDAPILTPSAITINSGEKTILTASSSTTGLTFTWYIQNPVTNPAAVAVSTASNGQNGTFLTPVLSASTTYYVVAKNPLPGGCTSAPSSVLITVLPLTSPVSIPCEAATGEEHNTGGIVSILATVSNPTFVFDDNINSGASLMIPVGIGSYVYQRAIFTGTSYTGDKIRLRLVSPGKLLSVSLLPSLVLTTYNGATSNGDALNLSNPLLNVQLLSAGGEAIIEYTPTKTFDRVEIRLNSGLLGALTSVNFNYAQRVIAAPLVTAATAGSCAGSSTVLSVQNPQTDGSITYKWYRGTTYLTGKDGATYTTDPSLIAGTYDFFVSSTRNGCESPKTQVTVTVLGSPLPPVASTGNPATTCPNTPVTLRVNAVTGIMFNWYNVLAGGTPLVLNNNTYTIPANLSAGIYDFFVEAVNANGCTSASRTKISITVNGSSAASDITIANQTVCPGTSVVLSPSSTTITNPVFTFYTNANKTGLITTGVTGNGILTLTGLTAGTYTYYVAVSGTGKCENAAGTLKAVTVTVNGSSLASDITIANQTVCPGTSVVLSPSSTTITNPVFTFYTNANKTGLITTGVTGNGVLTLTGLAAGTYTYYVAVSGTGKCENAAGTLKAVTISVNGSSVASDITIADQTVCPGTSVVLSPSSTTITNPVFTFYTNANKTGLITTGVTGNGVLTLTGLSAGTYTYYVAVSGTGKCENGAGTLKAVTVIVNGSSVVSDITIANQTVCPGTSVVLAPSSTTITNPVFTFYSNANKTGLITTGVTGNGVLTLTGLDAGTYTYYVAVSGTGKCENAAGTLKAVTIIINGSSIASDITIANQTVCSGASVVLSPTSTTITNPVFTFYSNANKTSQITAGVTGNGVLTLTGLAAGTYTYYIAVSGTGKCENAAGTLKAVTVVVNSSSTAADITIADQSACEGSTVILNPTSTTITNPVFTFYSNANKTGAITAGVSGNGVLTLTGLTAGTYTYYIAVSGTNRCESAAGALKAVTITIGIKPLTPTVTSSSVSVCNGSTAVLSVSNPQTGITYNWYNLAAGGTLQGTGISFTTPAIVSATSFYVEAASATCTSTSRTMVTVTPVALPTAPANVAVSNTPLCSGTAAQLAVINPDATLTYRWYASSTGGTALTTGTTYTTVALTATTTFYVESVSAAGCTSSVRTAVVVNVLPVLGIPVVKVQTTTINSITFAWANVTGASAYEVSTDGGITWIAPSSGAAGTIHIVSGLQPAAQVTILVRAKGTSACQTSAAASLTGTADNPLANGFFIPNTFTPNGDGRNDIFYVYGNTIAKLKMRIYTQWGQFLYESLNLQNGWDGSFKGQMQPNGVYVYNVEVTFTDGTTALRKGTITLLR